MQKTIFLSRLVVVPLCLRAYAGDSSLVAWWKFDAGRSIRPGQSFCWQRRQKCGSKSLVLSGVSYACSNGIEKVARIGCQPAGKGPVWLSDSKEAENGYRENT